MQSGLRIAIKILGFVEIAVGLLGNIFAVLLLVHSYPLLHDPGHVTGGSFGVAYGQVLIIICVPVLVTGLLTFFLKPVGRILHIVGGYLIIAATVGIVSVNIYTLLKYEGLAYFKEEAGYLLELIWPIAGFIILPAAVIYLFSHPKVKDQFHYRFYP